MEDQPSKLWNVALVFSLLALAVACYIKMDPVRSFVDEKCPWIKDQLASHGIQLPGVATAQAAPSAAPETQISSANVAPVSVPAPAQAQGNAGTAAPKTAPAAVKVAQTPVDMTRLAADPSLWPKKIHLKKEVTFPAVMNKQKVGELHVPAGTEVMLVQIRADNKLGVAYTPSGSMENAGGAVIAPEDTDILERANTGR
ncbi:MAG: hypothetical protein ACFUZC_01900 [Chthoniobacteraceae bacterium]